MFGKALLLALLVLVAWAFLARASQGAGHAQRYTVKPGDTLWTIAVQHYAGDPRDGIWKIQRENHLAVTLIRPGERLLLP